MRVEGGWLFSLFQSSPRRVQSFRGGSRKNASTQRPGTYLRTKTGWSGTSRKKTTRERDSFFVETLSPKTYTESYYANYAARFVD